MENAKVNLCQALLLFLLLLSGWIIRLYDLDEPPLDFHPTRQLFSALKARGMYYAAHPGLLPAWQQEFALQQRRQLPTIEPEIIEHLVAWTYNLTGEALWVARLYSASFWVIGGLFLWLLVCRRFSAGAASLSLALYLFPFYAVIASRSFQPDPLMVMLLVALWWALDRWQESPTWQRAWPAALAGGLAILVKFPALFFVYPPLFGRFFWKENRSKKRLWQTLVLALLIAVPATIYLAYGLWTGFLAKQFGGRFFPQLWFRPTTYLQWMQEANRAAGVLPIALGLLGLVLLVSPRVSTRSTTLLISLPALWAGYLFYGFAFTHHITTHDYYHLPLIPLVALSSAPLFDLLLAALSVPLSTSFLRWAIALVLLYALFGTLWGLRAQLKATDYRPQAAMWAEIGEKLGHRPGVIALTPDYGLSLAYWGWQPSQAWPSSADLAYSEQRSGKEKEPHVLFAELTAGKRYFLVADLADFRRQPALQSYLQSLPLFAEGEGYRIYLLQP